MMHSACLRAAAAALLLATVLVPSSAVSAREVEVPALFRYLEAMDVGPAVEHRLLVVHPIVRRRETPPETWVRLGGVADPDHLALSREAGRTKIEFDAVALGDPAAAFFPGDVLRADKADYV